MERRTKMLFHRYGMVCGTRCSRVHFPYKNVLPRGHNTNQNSIAGGGGWVYFCLHSRGANEDQVLAPRFVNDVPEVSILAAMTQNNGGWSMKTHKHQQNSSFGNVVFRFLLAALEWCWRNTMIIWKKSLAAGINMGFIFRSTSNSWTEISPGATASGVGGGGSYISANVWT